MGHENDTVVIGQKAGGPDRPEQPTWKCDVCLHFPHKAHLHPMFGTHEDLDGC
jgi:hypothetical protein